MMDILEKQLKTLEIKNQIEMLRNRLASNGKEIAKLEQVLVEQIDAKSKFEKNISDYNFETTRLLSNYNDAFRNYYMDEKSNIDSQGTLGKVLDQLNATISKSKLKIESIEEKNRRIEEQIQYLYEKLKILSNS